MSRVLNPARRQLIVALHDIGAVRFGEFKLKSGIISPIYVDLRILISHPSTLGLVADALIEELKPLSFQRIAAIPYSALPIATAVSLKADLPLIYPRREEKGYGTRRRIEGEFEAGETAVVIDDVITTGDSKLEAIAPLEAAGLILKDIAVVVDRGQGGAREMGDRGYRLHSVLHLEEILGELHVQGLIDEAGYSQSLAFLAERKAPTPPE
jgi:uridine monophosphate synthetase